MPADAADRLVPFLHAVDEQEVQMRGAQQLHARQMQACVAALAGKRPQLSPDALTEEGVERAADEEPAPEIDDDENDVDEDDGDFVP